MKHVILSYDGSKHSMNAAKEITKLAKGFPEMKVSVVSVVEYETAENEALDLTSNFKEKTHERQETIRRELSLLTEANIHFDVELLYGDPGDEIVRYANNHSADLIVMGSRGVTNLKEFFVGSVSRKVIKESKIPVYVAK